MFDSIGKFTIILILVFLVSCFFTVDVFAQDCRIIKMKGKVQLREAEGLPWREAKKGEFLRSDYELLTGKRSECTFGFGENIDRALTLKANSQMKIDDADIGKLKLAKGRVFSLLENMKEKSDFEIRTPTAIAGARGTGWTVEAKEEETAVRCFEGTVYVKGLDEEGNPVSNKDISEGTGVDVVSGEEIPEPVEVTKKERKQWNSFKDVVKDLIGKPIGKIVAIVDGVTSGAVEGYINDKSENPFGR